MLLRAVLVFLPQLKRLLNTLENRVCELILLWGRYTQLIYKGFVQPWIIGITQRNALVQYANLPLE